MSGGTVTPRCSIMIEGVLDDLVHDVASRTTFTLLPQAKVDEIVQSTVGEIRQLLAVECGIEWVP